MVWNINGIKRKFSNSDVVNIFNGYDIVIIDESHFGVRSTWPKGFIFASRSNPVVSKKPTGGVAVYQNNNFHFHIDIISNYFRDCVVFKIRFTDLVVAAMYIPPRNSEYYDDIYFKNCELIMDYFANSHLIITGDLNSRVGSLNVVDTIYKHVDNPDVTINTSGNTLREIYIGASDFVMLNGYYDENKTFDSKFTFYRGNVRSQVDLALSNKITEVNSFTILDKYIYSDHCPIVITCNTTWKPSLLNVRDCSKGLLCYNHYDVNKRIKHPIPFSHINVVNVSASLKQLAEQLRIQFNDGILDVDIFNGKISNGIYNACMDNCQITNKIVDKNLNFSNCNSSHFKAMANINLYTYEILSKSNESCDNYLKDWQKYENLALQAENNELNLKCNKSWKNAKHDSKKMWDLIDWKGRDEIKNDSKINESLIKRYFTNIFQSEKTINNPTVSDIADDLHHYDFIIPILDDVPDMFELEIAIKSIRRGISFDGLPPNILRIIPYDLKEIILILIQNIFFTEYPKDWNVQLLHAITKPGHTYKNPQLRGIAVAPLLCRVYDVILDNRFRNWYVPNYEQ